MDEGWFRQGPIFHQWLRTSQVFACRRLSSPQHVETPRQNWCALHAIHIPQTKLRAFKLSTGHHRRERLIVMNSLNGLSTMTAKSCFVLYNFTKLIPLPLLDGPNRRNGFAHVVVVSLPHFFAIARFVILQCPRVVWRSIACVPWLSRIRPCQAGGCFNASCRYMVSASAMLAG